jgi:hypothetical protein
MYTDKEKLILWYLNYSNIDITDRKIYELSCLYKIPLQIFLKKIIERLKNIISVDDEILNFLQVDLNIKLNNGAYQFVKDFIPHVDTINFIDVNSKSAEEIKSILSLFEKVDSIQSNVSDHTGQPLPDPNEGRPYISWLKCQHTNCNKCFQTENELIKHLKEFKVYTPSYHKLHEDIVETLNLTENKIKTENITKCPAWLCKESNFSSPDQLINHLRRLGIKPFWQVGMLFPDIEEYKFKRDIKIYNTNECLICLENKTNIIFDKCMHQCYCLECYDEFIKNNEVLKCPLCRNFYNKIYPA